MRRLPALLALICLAAGWLRADDKPKIPPRFKVDVDEVVLRVTVTDTLNRYVVGLEKEHFEVFENKVRQSITHFSNDKAPLSVGIILDISGSMGDNMISARNSVTRFLEQGDPDDEYFLIGFNHQTELLQDFTSKNENVKAEVAITGASGRTALYDALYLGLEKIRGGRHDKKALIIITDGEDNSSRYTFSEVKDFARESDAQIYVIGERGDLGYGRGIINEIVRLSGGRAFFPSSFKQLDYYCDLIHTELRNQYVLGYISTDQSNDGKWRKIRVRLNPPEGLPRLSVRSKEGYFAPQK
jgi:Ca-activated chloride channel family protein